MRHGELAPSGSGNPDNDSKRSPAEGVRQSESGSLSAIAPKSGDTPTARLLPRNEFPCRTRKQFSKPSDGRSIHGCVRLGRTVTLTTLLPALLRDWRGFSLPGVASDA